ncbi:cytidylate kinase-like family protein [Tuwongella immobilis]|uniref:Cytidylate kinase n=1 Tax=Tuwongella immobilis TaxID=692036 RepID=A0A6C2YRN5_9BACT|nr:cytidylate kinase-like family protein [Tuwongella immobilis]VIP04146.1 Cytidylate kinase OS=Singulisphaera acidiphila (strain ATCC BAA-1392 / DSM 18658 / VKM B-2454 / MOB10) GN=Sinac_5301 PE=4 SV=1: Cytidylate_kin2 [Tuwongella immobilis]VTS05657.1 Cytidylate kinase OS=Singulisphaera acidiphila (strain ATCC BAA-1392 / DSM 18658 / VKM B-2454 / MOB10) GN=Sinac_5301 PE=4 SV=1: Cytidylate_kin2 [Tuwongella immobilis]
MTASDSATFPDFPHHGDPGDRRHLIRPWAPPQLTLAVSRESGARGVSIAQRVGKRLGWDVFGQDLLEFLAQDDTGLSQLRQELAADALAWVDAQLARIQSDGILTPQADLGELPRVLFLLAARGKVVIVGRGAGYLLPAESTLHVRAIAPLADRIAYMTQWQRLSLEEATTQVHRLDQRRREFLASQFRHAANDPYHFDLVVNPSRLGEDACAELCCQALQLKQAARDASSGKHAVAALEIEPT